MQIDVEEYYGKYAPMVLRRCRFLLKNEEKALDAMQDVFVKLLLYKEKLKGSYPSSLLYKIATNVCLNIIRQSKRAHITTDEGILAAIADSEDIENRIADRDFIQSIFHREKESTFLIAVMRFVDKMTLEEVAEETGLSVSGVRKRIRELQKKIRGLKGGIE